MANREEFVYSTLAQEEPSFADLVEACIAALPAYVDELAEALARSDGAAVARISHTIKGAAGSHGFRPFSDRASAIEKSACAGDLAPVAAELAELRRLLPLLRVLPELQA